MDRLEKQLEDDGSDNTVLSMSDFVSFHSKHALVSMSINVHVSIRKGETYIFRVLKSTKYGAYHWKALQISYVSFGTKTKGRRQTNNNQVMVATVHLVNNS